MKALIGQLMFIGISGPALTSDEKKFIVQNNIGGVTLFGRNLVEPKQVHALCSEIQSLRHQQVDRTPLFIAIDMEGGCVLRLKSPFTAWPSLAKLGAIDNPTVSFHFANRMGAEMKSVGINMDFAPCVDVLTNPKNTVIGDRAISTHVDLVEKHVSALIRGYMKAGIITCAKHFPGHGNTLIDSHEDLPVEDADMQRLEEVELIPFKKAFRSRVDMVLPAHIQYPNIDPSGPVTFSQTFLKRLIRDEMRFRGLIVTDDLGMKAMTKHYALDEIPVRALEAGADLLSYCNEPETPPIAIDAIIDALAQGRLKRADLEDSKKRILALKKEKLQQPDPLSLTEALSVIGHPESMRIAACIAKGETPEGLLPE